MGFGRWPLRLTSGPAIPENFAVELTSTSNVANFNITWTNTETPESYTIYYKTTAAATFTTITTKNTDTYSLSTGLLNNTVYDIYITAVNNGRESGKTPTIRQTFYLYPVKPTYTFTYEHLGYTVSWTNPVPEPPSTQTHTLYYTEIGSNTVDTTALTFANGSKNLTSLLAGTKTNGKQYACYVTITNGSFTRTENIGPVSGAPFADGGNSTITIYEKPDVTNVVLTPTTATTSVSIAVNTSNVSIFPSGTLLMGGTATKYKLYNNAATPVFISNHNSTPISITGLTQFTNYTYKISIINNFGIESNMKNITFKTKTIMNVPAIDSFIFRDNIKYFAIQKNNGNATYINIYLGSSSLSPFTTLGLQRQISNIPAADSWTNSITKVSYYMISQFEIANYSTNNYFVAAFYEPTTSQFGGKTPTPNQYR